MPTKPEILSNSPASRSDTVLDIDQLAVHFQLQGGALSRLFGLKARSVKAVDGVSVSLKRGEVLGLVGESGSGKSTFGRALLGLVPATDGPDHLPLEPAVASDASRRCAAPSCGSCGPTCRWSSRTRTPRSTRR